MEFIDFSCEDLFGRCVASSLAHAVATFTNPYFSYTQSWYGDNFSFHYGTGRGTISFGKDRALAAAAIREENSSRCALYPRLRASRLFREAPDEVRRLAEEQTLEFLYDDAGDYVVPVATAVFWTQGDRLVFPDTREEFLEHGSALIPQLIAPEQEFRDWLQEEFLETEEALRTYEFFAQAYQTGEHITRLPEGLSYLKNAEGLAEGVESLTEINREWGGLF